jgi:hypothetical protein
MLDVMQKCRWEKMNKLQTRICSIPYYRREQYDLLREASIDKETFSISYEEMMAITESTHRDMENKGFKVVRVDVDIKELLEWATSLSASLNPESRTKFAMEKLKEMISNKSITV